MATRSAAKAHRQSLKRHLRNRMVRRFTKTTVQQAEATIPSGDLEAARDAVRRAISALDRAAKKGVLHPNNAARRKSRLLLKFNAAVAAIQAPSEPVPKKRQAKATGPAKATKASTPAKASTRSKARTPSKARTSERKKAAK